MQLTEKHKQYWHCNQALTAGLLAIWFVATFHKAYGAAEEND